MPQSDLRYLVDRVKVLNLVSIRWCYSRRTLKPGNVTPFSAVINELGYILVDLIAQGIDPELLHLQPIVRTHGNLREIVQPFIRIKWSLAEASIGVYAKYSGDMLLDFGFIYMEKQGDRVENVLVHPLEQC